MKTYTDKQVVTLLKKEVRKYDTASEAAAKMGCTPAQLSVAVNGGHIAGRVLKAVGLQRVKVYAETPTRR